MDRGEEKYLGARWGCNWVFKDEWDLDGQKEPKKEGEEETLFVFRWQ